jgi:hypothetical protein
VASGLPEGYCQVCSPFPSFQPPPSPRSPPPFFVLLLGDLNHTPATPTCTHACTYHTHTHTHSTPLTGRCSSSSSSSQQQQYSRAPTAPPPPPPPPLPPPPLAAALCACPRTGSLWYARYAWHACHTHWPTTVLLPPPRAADPSDHYPFKDINRSNEP